MIWRYSEFITTNNSLEIATDYIAHMQVVCFKKMINDL